MADTTLPGVLLKGVAASRPAANAVAKGTIYSATDTGAITQSDGSSWSTYATISSGLADPMTTRGDIIIRNSSNTTARLGRGSAGTVLTSDGTDVSWAAPSGGSTIAYPSLKPGSPTDDFTSALSGWTAVSTNGSFSISTCHAQAIDGSHLSMYWFAQMGYIYKAASNVDQEWIVGGLVTPFRWAGQDPFIGIALLDTSGNGAGAIYHPSDNTCAVIKVTSGVWDGATASTTTSAIGTAIGTPAKVWLRLTRVTNTWRAYMSIDGVNWNESTASTISNTVTVARKAIGIFGASAAPVNQQLHADWVNTV